jgi:hypothetical protein
VQSHEALKIAVEEQGPKVVASALGVSLSLVYKWIEGKAANPLDRVTEIVTTTGSTLPLAHLCAKAGGTFVKRPLPAEIDDTKLVAETQRMLKEFSDVLQAMTTAFLDGHVSGEEAALIREEWEELLPIAEGLVRACELRALTDSRAGHKAPIKPAPAQAAKSTKPTKAAKPTTKSRVTAKRSSR